ncbi:MAG: serine/threonine-protein kinase, partial [Aggregatilineales bacterium]
MQDGDKFGQYILEDQVGKGGMATVYRARHARLERHVAIKIMHTVFLQDDSFRARFEREAQIVAKLEHPHIVPIYDYSEHNGSPYLVMKYIEGVTLKQLMLKTHLTLQDILRLMRTLADALDYAHRQGVLHRDLKPSNILIDREGRPYLTDFGLARMAQVGESTISHDMMLGTPFYVSPEQAQGQRDLTSLTDIYSFGVILYELITGIVPFAGDSAYAIVHAHIYAAPEPPSEKNPTLPKALDAVLLKALAKRPEDRYPTATDLMDAFAAAIGAADAPPA